MSMVNDSGEGSSSQDYVISQLAHNRVTSRYGPDIMMMPHWTGLLADEKATLYAELRGEPQHWPTAVPPTDADFLYYT